MLRDHRRKEGRKADRVKRALPRASLQLRKAAKNILYPLLVRTRPDEDYKFHRQRLSSLRKTEPEGISTSYPPSSGSKSSRTTRIPYVWRKNVRQRRSKHYVGGDEKDSPRKKYGNLAVWDCQVGSSVLSAKDPGE